ncbi:MAG: nucleoside triphosphate pyrophosphohydrolase [Limnochordia bacterium]|jgi:tetrapyrrole methylase family protein/MazG family protein|nr:nucleoside triphosphate pyrophosphohydrolase [Limnochordia bacterium]MDI9466123.1 nucleoside triphosphate pyrophosphohydrolase [Bacillota bacterium]NLO95894.1 nucleoside triphosphate pyrophosphohydrolase [Bacillota bacterium]HAN95849.1 nucleoside triphosphate pyrophosphohydrolase [Bacillota bacterium]HOB40556.1 nucleoside triphosphate pyrophosphohydrolase [Limnochordia bacterium]
MSWSNLVNIVAKLRSPEGCPWDRAQTHTSLKRFLLEEAYELLEAIDAGDPQAMKDELGDVLLQVLLHAQIAAENGQFSMDDVITNLSEKLVRRHPHVFGQVSAETPEEVMVNWEAIKRREKAGSQRTSVLDGVPKELPALMRAEKIQKKAAKVGFDWDHTWEVVEKVKEEFKELEEAAAAGQQAELEEELGDLLFAVVNLARFIKVDPEFALQKATAKFIERFHLLESYAQEADLDLAELDLDGLNELWDRAKDHLRRKPQA